jgi:hypothetical protein
MRPFDEGGVVAVTDGRQLEALDGEGEVVVVRVVDDEPGKVLVFVIVCYCLLLFVIVCYWL